MTTFPSLVRSTAVSGVRHRLGHPLIDRYLELVAGPVRPNTLRAAAFDLKTFLEVVGKDRLEVDSADVFEFLAQQRGDRTVVRLADRESGVSRQRFRYNCRSVDCEVGPEPPDARAPPHLRLPDRSLRRRFR